MFSIIFIDWYFVLYRTYFPIIVHMSFCEYVWLHELRMSLRGVLFLIRTNSGQFSTKPRLRHGTVVVVPLASLYYVRVLWKHVNFPRRNSLCLPFVLCCLFPYSKYATAIEPRIFTHRQFVIRTGIPRLCIVLWQFSGFHIENRVNFRKFWIKSRVLVGIITCNGLRWVRLIV